jgi:hypothetical protein
MLCVCSCMLRAMSPFEALQQCGAVDHLDTTDYAPKGEIVGPINGHCGRHRYILVHLPQACIRQGQQPTTYDACTQRQPTLHNQSHINCHPTHMGHTWAMQCSPTQLPSCHTVASSAGALQPHGHDAALAKLKLDTDLYFSLAGWHWMVCGSVAVQTASPVLHDATRLTIPHGDLNCCNAAVWEWRTLRPATICAAHNTHA